MRIPTQNAEEIEELFGPSVRGLVEEVTDNKSLPKHERKRIQVEHAPRLSTSAKLIKLPDKISNVRDVTRNPPKEWTRKRRQEYLEWSVSVVEGCRGVNHLLEREFERVVREGRKVLSEPNTPVQPTGFAGG